MCGALVLPIRHQQSQPCADDGRARRYGRSQHPVRPMRGFKTLKTAYATIKGFEVMRALRNGQASSFNITRDMRGEARLVERAFDLGPCVLADALRFISRQPGLQHA